MSVSKTLRKVAYSKWYKNEFDYMCLSLLDAQSSGLISVKEANEARQAVGEFIGDYNTMSDFLKSHCVRNDYSYKKALYSDWDNRYNYLVKEELTFWQKVKVFFKKK